MKHTFIIKRVLALLTMIFAASILSKVSARVVYEVIRGTISIYGDEYGPSAMLDGNVNTKWCGASTDQKYENGWWVIFMTSEPICPVAYSVTTADDVLTHPDRNWKSWKIYGANFENVKDAVLGSEVWTLLDQKENISTDQMPKSNHAKSTFYMSEDNHERYSYFLIYISDVAGIDEGGVLYKMQMSEFSFFDEKDPDVPEEPIVYKAIGGTKSQWGNDYSYQSLVDGTSKTKWCSAIGDEQYDDGWWIVFKTTKPIQPLNYSITTADDTQRFPNRNWQSWKIYAGNFEEGETVVKESPRWILIDQRTNVGNQILTTENYADNYFSTNCDSDDQYMYFKIEIPEIVGDDTQQMGEFYFLPNEKIKSIRNKYYIEFSNYESETTSLRLSDEYARLLTQLKQEDNIENIQSIVASLQDVRSQIIRYNTVMANYQYWVEYASKMIAKYSDKLLNDESRVLKNYLSTNTGPTEEFPNGTYEYITGKDLDPDIIQDEVVFLQNLIFRSLVHNEDEDANMENITFTPVAGTSGYENCGYENLMDGDGNSKWCTLNTMESYDKHKGWWAIFKASEPFCPMYYYLETADDANMHYERNWVSWKIYGANFAAESVSDYSTDDWMRQENGWVLIDEKQHVGTDMLPYSDHEICCFVNSEFASEPFQYFRIEVSEVVSGNCMQMSELTFGNQSSLIAERERYYMMCSDFDMSVLAQKSLKDSCNEKIKQLQACQSPLLMNKLYNEIVGLQNAIEYSNRCYLAYQDSITSIIQNYDEDWKDCALGELLYEYLFEEKGLSDRLVNGSFPYIIKQCQLDSGQLSTELANIDKMHNALRNEKWYVLECTNQASQRLGGDALCDKDESTKWQCGCSVEEPAYLIILSPKKFVPFMYSVMTASDASFYPNRNWKSWRVYGGDFHKADDVKKDASGWILLDERENVGTDRLPSKNAEPCYFGLANSSESAYSCYMIQVSEALDGNIIQMSELSIDSKDKFEALRRETISRMSLETDVIAQKQLLDEYSQIKLGVENASDMEVLAVLLPRIDAIMSDIKLSSDVYAAYQNIVDEAICFLEANQNGNFQEIHSLRNYVTVYEMSSESFNHGTYPYIVEKRELDVAEMENETTFLAALLKNCLRKEYGSGTEVTRLFENLDFSDGFNFWSNDGFTIDRAFGNPIASIQTYGKGSLTRTITGLKDGLYEVRLNGFFTDSQRLPFSYGAFLTANSDMTPIMMIREGDCPNELSYIEGYRALAGGNHQFMNSILAKVSDGNLTFSINIPEIRPECLNCVALKNFQIIYHGTDEQTAAASQTALNCQSSRAKFLMNYQKGSALRMGDYPNLSQDIQDEMSALMNDGAVTYSSVQKFSDLFQKWMESKKAYYAYMKALIQMEEYVMNGENDLTEDQKLEYILMNDSIWNNLMQCSYSTEDAVLQSDLKQSIPYIYLYGEVPPLFDGRYEISSAGELLWFARQVNKSTKALNAVLVSDIDISKFTQWVPIGTPSNPFRGAFDGQNHVISVHIVGNQNRCGLFGTVKSSTISNFYIKGSIVCTGTSNGAIAYADKTKLFNIHSSLSIDATKNGVAHAAGIVGDLYNYSVIENSAFYGDVVVGEGNKDSFGGVVALATTGTIRNCANYGSVSFVEEECYAGGILGYVNNSDFGGIANCLSVGSVRRTVGSSKVAGAIAGWLRSLKTDRMVNNYWLEDSSERANGGKDVENVVCANEQTLASGAICYALNMGQVSDAWFQNIGEDPFPLLDNTHGKVIMDSTGSFSNGQDKITDIRDCREQSSIYSINGMRMDGAHKGLYIVNGIKTLFK